MKALIQMRSRGQITLPGNLRKILGLEAGDYFEVDVQDSALVLKPCKSIPKNIPEDEAWYWTETWQLKERRAQEDIKRGRLKSFDNADDFIKDLNE